MQKGGTCMVWNWRRKATGLVLASVCFAVGGLIYHTYTDRIPAVFAAEKENLLNASSIILSVGDSYSLSLYGAEKCCGKPGARRLQRYQTKVL